MISFIQLRRAPPGTLPSLQIGTQRNLPHGSQLNNLHGINPSQVPFTTNRLHGILLVSQILKVSPLRCHKRLKLPLTKIFMTKVTVVLPFFQFNRRKTTKASILT